MTAARVGILAAWLLIPVACVWAEDELVILSPHWEGIRYEFGEAFGRAHRERTGRGLHITWLDVGGTSDILKYVRSQFKGKPEGIGVDLLFGGGTDPFERLKALNRLERFEVAGPVLEKIPRRIGGMPLYDPDRTWYAAAMSGFGIIYNTQVLQRLGLPIPATWADLADPRYFTWVGSADPRKSGSVHMMYEIILQAYGWERGWRIISGLGANVRSFSGAGSQPPKDVAVGEVACGMAIDFYAWAQVRRAGEHLIGYVMPDDLTVVNGDGIAMLRGAPHAEIAGRFIEFVLGEAGQRLWMLPVGGEGGPRHHELARFSVLPHLYEQLHERSAVKVNPFRWRSAFRYDARRGSRRWGLVNDLVGSLVIEPHRQLVRDTRRRGRPPDEPPLVSAAEVQQIIDADRWRDPIFRNKTIRQWSARARRRYGDENMAPLWRSVPALAGLGLFFAAFLYLRRKV